METASVLRSGKQSFSCPDCGADMIVMTDERGQPCALGHLPPGCSGWQEAKDPGAINGLEEYGARCMRAAGGLRLIEGGKS
jgi:hypothetical protein